MLTSQGETVFFRRAEAFVAKLRNQSDAIGFAASILAADKEGDREGESATYLLARFCSSADGGLGDGHEGGAGGGDDGLRSEKTEVTDDVVADADGADGVNRPNSCHSLDTGLIRF